MSTDKSDETGERVVDVSRLQEPPPQVYARVGGALYLLVFALGSALFDFPSFRGGAGAAAAHIVSTSESHLRFIVAEELASFLIDVPLALIFYVLLRPVSQNIALLAAFFRLGNAFMGSLSVLGRLAVLVLFGHVYQGVFTPPQMQALAVVYLSLHAYAQEIGLVLFGMHCILLGILIYRSRYLPKLIGACLPLVGIIYIAYSFLDIIAPVLADRIPFAIFIPGIVTEGALSLWLLVKGVDTAGWIRRQTQSQQPARFAE